MITFLRFGRAHTLVGTTVSLLALYLLAARYAGAGDWGLFLFSLFSCLAANVYITGLNQITDVEIDRINKPYLPIASGAYSLRKGKIIVVICGVLAVVTCLVYPPWLTATVLVSMLIGTAYSVEPVRLKRYHFWAAFCIIAVRGLVVNLLLFAHFHNFLARTQVQSRLNPADTRLAEKGPGEFELVQWWNEETMVIWLLTAVIFIFGLLIAWFKDLPDTAGDAAYGIRTLTLQRDRRWVYTRGAWLLAITLLAGAAVAWWVLANAWLAIGHIVLCLVFGLLTTRLNLNDERSIAQFYQGTWGVFFGVYLLFAVAG